MASLSALDWALLIFLLTHIPITIFVDSQALLPERLYPDAAKDLLRAWADEYKDPFMAAGKPPDAWFTSLVACEVLFQLPFFFVGAYGIWTGASWLRTPGIIYGAHVCTTMAPVLGELLLKDHKPGLGPQTLNERLALVAFYAPYLIMPALLLAKCISMPVTAARPKAD